MTSRSPMSNGTPQDHPCGMQKLVLVKRAQASALSTEGFAGLFAMLKGFLALSFGWYLNTYDWASAQCKCDIDFLRSRSPLGDYIWVSDLLELVLRFG